MKYLCITFCILSVGGCSVVPLTDAEKKEQKIYEQIAQEEYLCSFPENHQKKYTYRACGGYVSPKKPDPVVVAPAPQPPPLLTPANQLSKALKKELKGLREILEKK